MARDSGPPQGHALVMADVVLLLVTGVILALLGVLAAHGWAAESRDQEWARSPFAERRPR